MSENAYDGDTPMKPKITKHTYKVDGEKKACYLISHEFHDRNWDVFYSWDILAFGDKGDTILAIWEAKNLIWVSPDAFVWDGALELIGRVHEQINQPSD